MEDKKFYEISYLMHPDLNGTELENKVEEFKRIILELGGKIIFSFTPKKQKLAYAIKKQLVAYFGYFKIEANPETIQELRQKLVFRNEILRYMMIAKGKELKPDQERLSSDFEKIKRPAGLEFSRESVKEPMLQDKESIKDGRKEGTEIQSKEDDKIDLSQLDKKLKEIFE